MAKAEKKKKVYLTGRVEVKTTLSQLRDPAKDKDHSRGPGQIGQLKDSFTVHIGRLPNEEVARRLDLARKVLATGKMPAAAKPKKSSRSDTTDKAPKKSKVKLPTSLHNIPGTGSNKEVKEPKSPKE